MLYELSGVITCLPEIKYVQAVIVSKVLQMVSHNVHVL